MAKSKYRIPNVVLPSSIPLPIADAVAEIARRSDKPISHIVRAALADYIARQTTQQAPFGRVVTVHSQDERR